VGIGGHISSDDASTGDAYEVGMQRELEEEIHIGADFSSACVGLINDDETEVGRVHLGIVHRFDLQSPLVNPREEGIQGAGFQPVSEMLQNLEGFETWSSICLSSLFAS
jgi:predicted NUDIX family phosphoesterase